LRAVGANLGGLEEAQAWHKSLLKDFLALTKDFLALTKDFLARTKDFLALTKDFLALTYGRHASLDPLDPAQDHRGSEESIAQSD
jgi:hypothetical protein